MALTELRHRLSRMLHNATPPPVYRGVAAVPDPDRTLRLPPVQPRYQGLRADAKARNRQQLPQPRRGSMRQAVGL